MSRVTDPIIRREPAQHDQARRASGAADAKGHRMGLLEYTLLALIGLGIAVTLVLAIIDPPG